jgi:hypothetical protein
VSHISRRRLLGLIAAAPVATMLPAIPVIDVGSYVFVHRARSGAVPARGEIVIPVGVSVRDPEFLFLCTVTEESAVIFAAELRLLQYSGDPA